MKTAARERFGVRIPGPPYPTISLPYNNLLTLPLAPHTAYMAASRDADEGVDVVVVTVPAAAEPGGVARVHLMCEPIGETEAHWNNEAEQMILWVDPPEGWEVDSRAFTYPLPPEVVTKEQRTIEVEIRAPEETRARSVTIPAYALYYVCEDVNGVCMYRRQDLELEIGIRR